MDPECGSKAYYLWTHTSVLLSSVESFLILSNIIPFDVYSQFKLLESTLSTFTLTTCLLSTKQTYPSEEPLSCSHFSQATSKSPQAFSTFFTQCLCRGGTLLQTEYLVCPGMFTWKFKRFWSQVLGRDGVISI